MSSQNVKIAIIGFGTVGAGVAKILLEKSGQIHDKTGLSIQIAHVVDTDLSRSRPVTLPPGLLHDNLNQALDDSEVSIVVELVGGTTFAADLQKNILSRGKNVVTANKALLAERGQEIYAVAREHHRCVAFEASCCGGIPVIGALRTGLAANSIQAMYGIVNGTCNYILTEMTQKGKKYATALKEAQHAGYAEADPTLDVCGADSAHKLAILAMLAFGKQINYSQIPVEGIDKVDLTDIRYGLEMGYAMKLLAIAEQNPQGLSLRVHPSFINMDHPLAKISGAFNGISIFGDAVGHTSYYGRGAGMMPTASAVVADIIEVARGNSQRIFDAAPGFGRSAAEPQIHNPDDIQSRFYLRFTLQEKPGVLARIAKVLGDHKISISGCIQHESEDKSTVPAVVMTHRARQGDVLAALQEIETLDVVRGKPVCLHVVTPPEKDL